jgi:hypothetical protein
MHKNFMTQSHSRRILVILQKTPKSYLDLVRDFDSQHKRTIIRRLKDFEKKMKCVVKSGNRLDKYHLTPYGDRLLQWTKESLRSNVKPQPKTADLRQKQTVVERILDAVPKIRSCIDSCDGEGAGPIVLAFLGNLVSNLKRVFRLEDLYETVERATKDVQSHLAALDPIDQGAFRGIVSEFQDLFRQE